MEIWNTIFYQPLYNALIWLVDILPGGSLALAIVFLTLIVKIILSPLSRRSIVNQITQKKLQPYVNQIRAKFTDKQEQAKKLLEFYKINKSSPFSGCLLVLIQLPIIIALYTTFLRGVQLDGSLLYSFVPAPEQLSTIYLGGFINLAEPSIGLALVTGLVQLIQVTFSPAFRLDNKKSDISLKKEDMSADEMQAVVMNKVQGAMKYLVPVMITVFAMAVPSAVALYWLVTNLFTILQEVLVVSSFKEAEVLMPEGFSDK